MAQGLEQRQKGERESRYYGHQLNDKRRTLVKYRPRACKPTPYDAANPTMLLARKADVPGLHPRSKSNQIGAESLGGPCHTAAAQSVHCASSVDTASALEALPDDANDLLFL